MSRAVKWTLAVALLIAALLFAYVRISDAYWDLQIEMRNNSRIDRIEPKQPETEPQQRPAGYPHDSLIRT
jgi:hypothetical protein